MVTYIVVVDTETTGFGSKADVIEIGAVTRVEGELKTFEAMCNPGEDRLKSDKIQGALDVNGITMEEIRAAKPIEDVANNFWRWLEENFGDDWVLCAHNVPFDAGFLEREPWSISKDRWQFDTMEMAGGYIALDKCLDRYKIEREGDAHRALSDAKATMRLLEVLLEIKRKAKNE